MSDFDRIEEHREFVDGLEYEEWREQILADDVTPDPKPVKRHRATAAEWKEIREAFAAETCWVCGDPWTELHHILNRSHSGDDVTVNLAPLCRECHRLVEARDPGARAALRGALMPSHLAYLRYRLGEGAEAWLDRFYVRGQVAAA